MRLMDISQIINAYKKYFSKKQNKFRIVETPEMCIILRIEAKLPL